MQRLAFQEYTLIPGYAGDEAPGISTTWRDSGLLDANGVPVPGSESRGLGASVSALESDGVLVSASDHQIDLISELGYDARTFTGIGYMQITFDFIVAIPP